VTGVDAFTDYYDPAQKQANLAGLADDPRFDLVRDDVVTASWDRLLAAAPAVVHLAAQPGVRGSFGTGCCSGARRSTARPARRCLTIGTAPIGQRCLR
jgi:hypothetical protein